jgi:hypothetical protein
VTVSSLSIGDTRIRWKRRSSLISQDPGAFDTAVKDVDGIVHMASPFT